MENNSTLKCDQEAMFGFYLMLMDITVSLTDAYEKAGNARDTLEGAYEGEAKSELSMFLRSLPMHIYRLQLLYTKLMEFIYVTADSMMKNDMKMQEKLGG